jgi:CRP-like cAMP-binding protein
MDSKPRKSFSLMSFLNEAGEGRAIEKYSMHQVVFSQGDPAGAVFYVLKGQVKVAIVSERGKEAVIAIHGANSFLAKGVWLGAHVG